MQEELLTCPSCGMRYLDLHAYDSMMVLRDDLALFSLICPNCKTKVTTILPIPTDLLEEVQSAALEVDAGMGRN